MDNAYGPNDTSEDVYRDIVAPLIPWAWGGGVSTLFAYGQTASGKTFTVTELERLAATDLMNGHIQGNREVHTCVFELIGKNAFGITIWSEKINIYDFAKQQQIS